MRQLFFTLIILSLISCSKVISRATKPIVDCVTAAINNKELQTLQSNLVTYWLTNGGKWPNDKLALMKFSDSIEFALSPKFVNLAIRSSGDSVLADYQLIYEESDKTEYKNVSGELSIRITSDTTVNLTHKTDRVEMKNGTICASKSSQQIDKES